MKRRLDSQITLLEFIQIAGLVIAGMAAIYIALAIRTGGFL